jgi:phosphoglycolate phosphatase-like HAD superfamily hydrolase
MDAMNLCQVLIGLFLLVGTTCTRAFRASLLPKPLVGVIFDMDGTLIQPCIDFPDMRRRIYEVASEDAGIPVTQGDVVTMVDTFSPPSREKAMAIFADIEAKALRDMKLMPGMLELCQYLDDNNIRRAVLTRNVETSVQYMEQHFMKGMPPFQPQVARDTVGSVSTTTTLRMEDGINSVGLNQQKQEQQQRQQHKSSSILRPKPHPDGILYICQQWQCLPSQTIMVGDSDLDDIVAGNRAGCGATIHLVRTGMKEDNDSGNADESAAHEQTPTVRIDSLQKIQALLAETLVTSL